jgi:hypothetical protein
MHVVRFMGALALSLVLVPGRAQGLVNSGHGKKKIDALLRR